MFIGNINPDVIMSERKDSIFYGDIFIIEGQGCLFFGFGKTKAGQSAINDKDDEKSLDFACITRDKDNVYGHFQMEFRHKKVDDPIKDRVQLNYFIRHLNSEETKAWFTNKPLQVQEIDYSTFIKLSASNILFMPFTVIDEKKRMDHFVKLTLNSNIKKCLIVPWMNSHEEKGKLLREYILKNK